MGGGGFKKVPLLLSPIPSPFLSLLLFFLTLPPPPAPPPLTLIRVFLAHARHKDISLCHSRSWRLKMHGLCLHSKTP